MELKDLIISIKQFEKKIISYKEYCDVWSEHYLYRDGNKKKLSEDGIEWAIINNLLSKLENSINFYYPNLNIYDHLQDYKPIYSEKYQLLLKDGQKNSHWAFLESIAIIEMYKQIEILLDSIDVELTILEMENKEKHEYICKELLPVLLDKIQKIYPSYEGKSPHQICTHINKYNKNKNANTDNLQYQELASYENEYQKLQKNQRVKMLFALGILEFLKNTYPKCKNNESEIARILCKFSPDLKPETTIQSYVHNFMNHGLDNKNDKDLEIIDYVNKLKN
jgi:hypothetical protein